jgi:hypothetical protein
MYRGPSWDRSAPPDVDPFDPLEQAKQIMAAAQQKLNQAERTLMQAQLVKGFALWCDQGGHAFSQRDRGRQEITAKVFLDDDTEPTEETRITCSDCAIKLGQGQTRPASPARAITGHVSVTDPAEAQRRGYDPAYVEWLEQQAQKPISSEAGG